MNTKAIQSTKPLSLPYCPILTSHKQSKIVTKHLTNAAIYLSKKEFALLCWLIYQSDANNKIQYSTHLLRMFSHAIKEINKIYGGQPIPTAIQLIRKDYKGLVEKGFLIPADNYHVINPMLVYSKRANRNKYKKFTTDYQKADINNLSIFETFSVI